MEIEASPRDGRDQADPKEEDTFEFRLFSRPEAGFQSSTKELTQASRIVLRSPSPVIGEQGFVQPWRPDSYYFTTELTAEERSRYESAALSGEAIYAEQLRRWVWVSTSHCIDMRLMRYSRDMNYLGKL